VGTAEDAVGVVIGRFVGGGGIAHTGVAVGLIGFAGNDVVVAEFERFTGGDSIGDHSQADKAFTIIILGSIIHKEKKIETAIVKTNPMIQNADHNIVAHLPTSSLFKSYSCSWSPRRFQACLCTCNIFLMPSKSYEGGKPPSWR
jgi:hypothetical protein